MTALSIIYVILFYVAMIVLVAGVANKIMQYIRVPAPLKIAVTPAPMTRSGVVYRFFTEVVMFNSLFRATKWTWIFGWIFHLSLLLAFLRHLRYVISPDSFLWPLVNLEVVQSFGKYAGFAMLVGLAGLLCASLFCRPRTLYLRTFRLFNAAADHGDRRHRPVHALCVTHQHHTAESIYHGSVLPRLEEPAQ